MPDFFSFQQGNETRARPGQDQSPLLGRFRAVPRPAVSHARPRADSQLGLLSAGHRGSVHVGYGALLAAELEDESDEAEDGSDSDDCLEGSGAGKLRVFAHRIGRTIEDLWVSPRSGAVKRAVNTWWKRWTLLVVLPAVLVSSFNPFFSPSSLGAHLVPAVRSRRTLRC